ncbi:14238_t:CDS:2, partial [Gigaspora margarita]
KANINQQIYYNSNIQSYAKKALDYAIWANKVDEFINYLERFIKIIKDDLDK